MVADIRGAVLPVRERARALTLSPQGHRRVGIEFLGGSGI